MAAVVFPLELAGFCLCGLARLALQRHEQQRAIPIVQANDEFVAGRGVCQSRGPNLCGPRSAWARPSLAQGAEAGIHVSLGPGPRNDFAPFMRPLS